MENEFNLISNDNENENGKENYHNYCQIDKQELNWGSKKEVNWDTIKDDYLVIAGLVFLLRLTIPY